MSRLLHLFSVVPLLLLLLPMTIGIAVAEFFYPVMPGAAGGMCMAFLSVVAGGCIVARRYSRLSSPVVLFTVMLAALLLGMLMLVTGRHRETVSWPEGEQTWRVMVAERPKETAKSLQFTGIIMGGPYEGCKVCWRLVRDTGVKSGRWAADTASRIAAKAVGGPGTAAGSSEVAARPLPGDVVLCRAVVTAPRNAGNPGEFDYATWLRRQGVAGTAFCYASRWKPLEDTAGDMPLSVRALRFREGLTARYADYFSGRELAVLSALTLGEKRGLDSETRDLYSQGGVSHVLALSGLHLSILFSVYQLLVLGICRRCRGAYIVMSCGGIAGLWAFALLAGFPLSLVRAAIMFTVMQLAGLFRHDSFSLNNLTLAALFILVISPQALFDIGFQLSCLSVLSVLLLASRVPRPDFVTRYAVLRWVYSLLAVSFVAQLMTAPLVAFYFHTVPVYGLLANLVAVPVAYVVLTLAVLFFATPVLQDALAPVLDGLLRSLDAVLDRLTGFPGAVLEVYPTALTTGLLYLLLLCLLLAVFEKPYRRMRYVYAAVAVLAACVGCETYASRPSRLSSCLIFYNLNASTPVHFVASAARSYLWQPADSMEGPSPMAYVERSFWKPQAMARPVSYADSIRREDIYCGGAVTVFSGKRVALLRRNTAFLSPPQPLPVDYLLIERGFNRPLSSALASFRPRMVVLSASLTAYYREKYTAEAQSAGLSFHDIRQQGALVVPLEH